MAITMDGIFVNGQKATFRPEDILSGDASAYTEEIGAAVEAWMEENVTGGEQVTDTTLTLPGVPADAKAAGDKINELKEDLHDTAVDNMILNTWYQGYIKVDGGIGSDVKSCVTDFIQSDGNAFVVKTASGYRSKIALYNSSQTFTTMLYSASVEDKVFRVASGNYIKVQISSDNTLPHNDVDDTMITVARRTYTAKSYNKAAGKPADSKDAYTVLDGLFKVDTVTYSIARGYYSKGTGTEGLSSTYAKTYKQTRFSDESIRITIGSGYKFAMRFWDANDVYDPTKETNYIEDGLFYVPAGWTIACNFVKNDKTTISDADCDAIAASFRIYRSASGEQFRDAVLGAYADFNAITGNGTYRAPSTYVASYINCPTTDYGRLIVFNSASDGYSCVQIYISYKNEVYTRILQVLNTSTWSTWTMLGGGDTGYLHDGEILHMVANPDAIPVGSEHLGYTAFMEATWETLLPNGYTDGDAYSESTTKIINIHVSRESDWQSTAYGPKVDTYPIYRYTFTPVGGYKKTVFLSAGCHGNEAEGYWGLYRLIKMIYFEGYKYPTLRNLRDYVRFIIVPSWNPWGLEHYRRFNAFEDKNLQAWNWFYAEDNTITVDGVDYPITDVGEADVIWDTITNYGDNIDLWIDMHTDPYAGRTTSAGEIDDPRGYTRPYGFYGFVKNGSKIKDRLKGVMEDFYTMLINDHNFTEKWHLTGLNPDPTGTNGFTPWMMSLSFPCALVEVSTFMHNFPYASGSAGMMKYAQEYYANCLTEMLR